MNPDGNAYNHALHHINIEISFQNNLAPKLKSLSETKYYEGGEASKAMDH